MKRDLASSLRHAALVPFWRDATPKRLANPPLTKDISCDLTVVGGGFTGLWTALHASKRNPEARIVLVEGDTCGNAASGRNGGFCAPSISHGIGNARRRWPQEAETLIRLGRENLDAFASDVDEFEMAAEFERAGKLNVAEQPWQIDNLRSMEAGLRRAGVESIFLEGAALRTKLDSPVYTAGLFEPNYALVNPGKMVAELRRACLQRGVEIYEQTRVEWLRGESGGITLGTSGATIRSALAVLATNASPPLLRRLRNKIIPLFDYAIVSEPLSEVQLKAIGWTERHGVADSGNQFHYSRKTADNRILWGGYDAIYHFASRRDETLGLRADSFNRLAANFARTFPALADVAFTHAWGGVIDTSARTTFFAGLAHRGRVAYAMGFTGQGVTASRFAALAMLDLLEGKDTERTRLAMLRNAPFPFPPEPLRYLGIRMAQRDLAYEDQTGRRSLFLRALDAGRIGFDS